MNYFPMFTDIKNREVLICGGGEHALEKLERLAPFGAILHVISGHISETALAEMNKYDNIVIERRRFSERDLDSFPVFVIAAEERKENERIADICRAGHIPVNAVDMQDICDFIFPAFIASEQLCIGISTGGASPAAAVELKRRIGECIPEKVDEIFSWMTEIRKDILREIPEKERRRNLLREIVRQAFLVNRPLTGEELLKIEGQHPPCGA